MPFIEVLGSAGSEAEQERAAAEMTGALADAWKINPEIVSVYFMELRKGGYSHAGQPEQDIDKRRIFLKIHAYPRSRAQREAAASAVTAAYASKASVAPSLVVIYFFDREPGHVAHGGKLSDG